MVICFVDFALFWQNIDVINLIWIFVYLHFCRKCVAFIDCSLGIYYLNKVLTVYENTYHNSYPPDLPYQIGFFVSNCYVLLTRESDFSTECRNFSFKSSRNDLATTQMLYALTLFDFIEKSHVGIFFVRMFTYLLC